jgi:hypothetical protein
MGKGFEVGKALTGGRKKTAPTSNGISKRGFAHTDMEMIRSPVHLILSMIGFRFQPDPFSVITLLVTTFLKTI